MPSDTTETLLVGVTLKGAEIERFNRVKEQRRLRTNAATGYVLILDGLEVAEKQTIRPEVQPAAATEVIRG